MSEHCANPARASASVRAINLWNSTIWGGPVAAEPKMQFSLMVSVAGDEFL
jgi:hypothetical protein